LRGDAPHAKINVIRIPLLKDRLRGMSREERALFFLLGYAANQITLFQRLLIFSTNKSPATEAEQKICGAQSQMLARLSIGVLYEAWKLVKTRFLASQMGKEFAPKLNPVGQAALTELKKHFGGSNLISKLRNNVAFHYPNRKDVDAGFEAAVNDKNWDNDWNWYFSTAAWNSFYFASDFIVLHAILTSIGETDLVAAQEKIMDEVKKVNAHMMAFLYALTDALLAKHFAPEMIGEVIEEISDAPSAFDVWLPFYVEIPPDDLASGTAP
jgi:hypothetical protein